MTVALLFIGAAIGFAQGRQSYLGFDRNVYPGDSALPGLRKSFRFTGYWLNNPPGEQSNSWTGKRDLLRQQGFGFLVLFNGRLAAQLKGKDSAALGTTDGKTAVAAAIQEGFATNVRIFLDQEEGGRLTPEQSAYIFAWIDAVRGSGARAGIYCSGIEVREGRATISTARDILDQEEKRLKLAPNPSPLALWVANDECPPSPGCISARLSPSQASSLLPSSAISVWQYAQSPRRAEFSASCPRNDDLDGNCYAPGVAHSASTYLDLNVANSADPSEDASEAP